jgi:hypothetical protein
MIRKIALSLLAGMIFLSGCIVVKHEQEAIVRDPEVEVSPKPRLPMSDKMVRSEDGDFISFIPGGWFFVDVDDEVSGDIIAVAMNPDYNLSAVFSRIRNNASVKSTVEKEGLFGLARLALNSRESKSAGIVKQVGNYQQMNLGPLEYVKYEFSSTGGAIIAKSAVFVSQLGHYYEFALLPMDVDGARIPPEQEINEVFQSILASIKY